MRSGAIFLAGGVSLCALMAWAAVDLNGNQQGDIWEALFGVTNSPAGAADADGDGFSNVAESIAGTDPYNPLSFPAISLQSGATGAVAAAWRSLAGKMYTVEAANDLNSPWVVITNYPGSNATQLAAINYGSFSQRLFRVRVGDVYSDGSGLSDWEKLQLGLVPTNVFSNGQYDPKGNALTDYAYVTNKLAAQNALTIVASDLTTVQPDPESPAQDPGAFTILRGGFPFRSVTGTVTLTGTAVEGLDYSNLPHTVTFPSGVISQTIIVTPLANTNLKTSVLCTMTLQPGTGYVPGSPSSASVVISPTPTPTGTGLLAQYWDYTNSASSYPSTPVSASSTGILVATRVDPTVDFTWNATNIPPGMTTATTFSVRWTGQVQPQYSEDYYFEVSANMGSRLWIDDQLIIDGWSATGDRTALPVRLVGGVRYNIRAEFWDNAGSTYIQMYWYSASQPKQIIPQVRLYPTNAVPPAPPSVVGVVQAYAILGYPFTNVVSVNNSSGITSVGPMPPGLVFTVSNRLISGVPTQAGRFQINIAATNFAGYCASVLDLTVVDTGAVISREVWTNILGHALTNIPLDTGASFTGQLATLEGPVDYGDNYGERWRGYLTAPLTGNYYFWIAASDAAELWIANDSEQVTKVKRCWVAPSNNVAPPPVYGTGSRVWTNQPSQKSPWLALSAGQRYYIEVLHKAGTNAGDNIAVGWVRPDQTNSLPSEIVPGQVLSPYISAVANNSSGTLYTATLLAQGSVVSFGQGAATLRLSADEMSATLRFNYTNLTAPSAGIHIHSEAFATNLGQTIFNVSAVLPQADGSYNWPITGAGTLTSSEVLEVIKEGKAYLDFHTTNYPGGEIRGNFTLATGASKFVPPPPPPSYSDDHTSSNAAVRFLTQATFGPSPSEIDAVRTMGYDAWIEDQVVRLPTYLLPHVLTNKSSDPTTAYPGSLTFNAWWERAVTANDQLRQRVAFALSEILVISDVGTLNSNARVEADYYDVLLDDAFGNFRQLIEDVTLTPGMGLYLDMRGNDKGNIISGTHPNENYAREIMQLFSIGLYKLWPDGTLVMNSKGDLISTYDQKEILGYAATFTGWSYYQTNQANGRLPASFPSASNYTNFMTLVPSRHDQGAKRVLDNIILPPAVGVQTNSANVEYDTYAQNDLEQALDAIFYNENVGPFICRQLIQRLVTSHPSRDYVYRVVQKFNDNGNGVRGDMKTVVKAILLDREARDPTMLNVATFGKLREPLLRITALARAFPPPAPISGTYAQTGTQTIAVSLPTAHRMASGDYARFQFDSGLPPPTTGNYSVTPTGTNSLNITANGVLVGTYSQYVGTLYVHYTDHYLNPSNFVHLTFNTGGATAGIYQVASAINNDFTAPTGDLSNRTGQVLIHRISGGYVVSGQGAGSLTNVIKFMTSQNHGLNPGDAIQVNFTTGTATDGMYIVSSNIDLKTFVVATGNQTNQTQNTGYIFPLLAPPLVRSGTVTLQYSTFNMGSTDTSLTQTPLNSPTVFNYYFPGYTYPGALAAAGLTTPEFQITSDSGVASVNNFLANGLINNQGTNSTMSSFSSGNEYITLDMTPWCSSNFTSNSNIPALVDSLGTLLVAGQLSASAKTSIVAYCSSTNVPYTTPTAAQMRDRVRAAVHLIVTTPDFSIQR